MAGWLITGAAGFLGRHLADRLRREGVPIHPVDRSEADLADPGEAARLLAGTAPEVIVHVAGATPPAPRAVLYAANLASTLNLLDAARDLGRPVRFVLVGSAAEYGPVPDEELPVREDRPCSPLDAYGLSKLLATTAGLAARPPVEVIVGRVFNPIGPGAPPSQVFGRLVRALSCPEGLPGGLEAGDLDARRDFIDARDVAGALVALARRGKPGAIYNIGTGESHSVREGLELLLRWSGRDPEIRTVPGRPGPKDSRADIARIVADTGWRPEVSWERSLKDQWDAARQFWP
jgi:nucleoside-diphosphate-sugar epimerase